MLPQLNSQEHSIHVLHSQTLILKEENPQSSPEKIKILFVRCQDCVSKESLSTCIIFHFSNDFRKR